ncbi:MAG: hypothetical protein N2645_04420 [Clostridia bacterium]|nr:hypothetical protein [Clostridia bacterium]
MSVVLWPFKTLFSLIIRIIGASLGLVFMIAGGILCLTIIASTVGAPLVLLGVLLMAKSFASAS